MAARLFEEQTAGSEASASAERSSGMCPTCGSELEGGRWQRQGIGLCARCAEPFYADGAGHERVVTAEDLAGLPSAGLGQLRRDQAQLRQRVQRRPRRRR